MFTELQLALDEDWPSEFPDEAPPARIPEPPPTLECVYDEEWLEGMREWPETAC